MFRESAMIARKGTGITPAARRWIMGFISGALSKGDLPYFLGHEIMSYFPRGDFYPGNKMDVMYDTSSKVISYINFLGIRQLSLNYSYKNGFDSMRNQNGDFDYFFSYNASAHQIKLGNFIKKISHSTKWIIIILDYEEETSDFSSFIKKTKNVDFYVFLSQWAYNNFPLRNKFLLEGGVDVKKLNERYNFHSSYFYPTPYGKKIILYSGMFSKWGGVNLLLESFQKIEDPDYELWICGFGSNIFLDEMANKDKRIKKFGIVTNEKLDQLSKQAKVFVNPRPTNIKGNNMNFPSKLIEYLTYCKPVVTTMTDGIPDEYFKICYVSKDNPESLKEKILEAANEEEYKLKILSRNIKNFLTQKSWEMQYTALSTWIER